MSIQALLPGSPHKKFQLRRNPTQFNCDQGEVSLAKVELTPLSINFIPTFPLFLLAIALNVQCEL